MMVVGFVSGGGSVFPLALAPHASAARKNGSARRRRLFEILIWRERNLRIGMKEIRNFPLLSTSKFNLVGNQQKSKE